jgi:hypothetical protein
MDETTKRLREWGRIPSALLSLFEKAIKDCERLKAEVEDEKSRHKEFAALLERLEKDYKAVATDSGYSWLPLTPCPNVVEAIANLFSTVKRLDLVPNKRARHDLGEKERDPIDRFLDRYWEERQGAWSLEGRRQDRSFWQFPDNRHRTDPFSVIAFPWASTSSEVAGLGYIKVRPAPSSLPIWRFSGFSEERIQLAKLSPLARLAIAAVTGVHVDSVPNDEVDQIKRYFEFGFCYNNRIDVGFSHSGAALIVFAIAYLEARFPGEGGRHVNYLPSAVSVDVHSNGLCGDVEFLGPKVKAVRKEWGRNCPLILSARDSTRVSKAVENQGGVIVPVDTSADLVEKVLGPLEGIQRNWLLSLSEAEFNRWEAGLTEDRKRLWESRPDGARRWTMDGSTSLGGLESPVSVQLYGMGRDCELRVAFGDAELASFEPSSSWGLVLCCSGCAGVDEPGGGKDTAFWPEMGFTPITQVVYEAATAALSGRPPGGKVFVQFLSAESPFIEIESDANGQPQMRIEGKKWERLNGKGLDQALRAHRASGGFEHRRRYWAPVWDWWLRNRGSFGSLDCILISNSEVPDFEDDSTVSELRPFSIVQRAAVRRTREPGAPEDLRIEGEALTPESLHPFKVRCGWTPFHLLRVEIGLGTLAPLSWTDLGGRVQLQCGDDGSLSLVARFGSGEPPRHTARITFDRPNLEPVSLSVNYSELNLRGEITTDWAKEARHSFSPTRPSHIEINPLASGALSTTSIPEWGQWECHWCKEAGRDARHLYCPHPRDPGIRGRRFWIPELENCVEKQGPPGIFAINENGYWFFDRTQVRLSDSNSALWVEGHPKVVMEEGLFCHLEPLGDAWRFKAANHEWLLMTI